MSQWIVIDATYPTADNWIEQVKTLNQLESNILLIGFSNEESSKRRKLAAGIVAETSIFCITSEQLNEFQKTGSQLLGLVISRWFEQQTANQVTLLNSDTESEQKVISPETYLAQQFNYVDEKAETRNSVKKSLAFVSPLPPEQTGIANYNQKLIPLLTTRYDITLVVQQASVSESIKQLASITIMSAEDFRQIADTFERIVYHIGNSLYHAWQFDLLKAYPGLVVLHDYYLFDAIWWQENAGIVPQAVRRSLYSEHGFPSLIDAENNTSARGPDHYPVNGAIIREAAGLVVHSTHAMQLHKQWYPGYPLEYIHPLPLYRDIPKQNITTEQAKQNLHLDKDTIIISSFGGINEKKATDLIVTAFLNCSFSPDTNVKLVLVGAENTSPFGVTLKKQIAQHKNGKQIAVTGYTDDTEYHHWMLATDIAIQLRKDSRGESSGTLFDAMAYGKCAIVNAHGSSAEVPNHCVWQLNEEISVTDLSQAITTLVQDTSRRDAIGNQALKWITTTLDKSAITNKYTTAIEASTQHPIRLEYHWLNRLSNCFSNAGTSEKEIQSAIKQLTPLRLLETRSKKRILFDISTLAWKDQKTGIERVTKELAIQLMKNPPEGYQVECIQWRGDTFYTHPDFAAELLEISNIGLTSKPVEGIAGDLYLSIEWSPPILEHAFEEMLRMRAQGVRFYFAVHDLLPILMPQYFPAGTDQSMQQWFNAVSTLADGLLCVSHCVATDVSKQLKQSDPANTTYIGVFNSGANFSNTGKHTLTLQESQLTETISASAPIKLLMVGTVEPRKGHQQVLDGFNELWHNHPHITLIIVGKQGWDVDHLIQQIKQHPKLNINLFWLKGCSDAVLQNLYQQSSGLIAASYGEGFGLPLIEAAQHKLPILARDIPIFREVVQHYAEFFRADNNIEMAAALAQFAQKIDQGELLNRPPMRYNSWKESAEQLIEQLLSDPALNRANTDQIINE